MSLFPRFLESRDALDAFVLQIKLIDCPHCGAHQTLIGHGFLHGYAEDSSQLIIRGRRFFCSNRGLKAGCGRTVSVLLAHVLRGFVLSTLSLWNFLAALGKHRVVGRSVIEASFPLSVRSAFRIRARIEHHSPQWRAWLCAKAPAPPSASWSPLAQLKAHLEQLLGKEPLPAFQLQSQTNLLR